MAKRRYTDRKDTPAEVVAQIKADIAAGRHLGHNKCSRFSEENVDAILGYVSNGLPMIRACALRGISQRTFLAWMDRGDKGQEKYAGLRERYELAKAEFVQRHVDNLDKVATSPILNRAGDLVSHGDWKASAWLLERSDRQNFGKRTVVEGTGPGGAILLSTLRDAVAIAEEKGDPGQTIDAEFEVKPEEP